MSAASVPLSWLRIRGKIYQCFSHLSTFICVCSSCVLPNTCVCVYVCLSSLCMEVTYRWRHSDVVAIGYILYGANTIPWLMLAQYTGHICLGLYVRVRTSVCVHAHVHMDSVWCVFLCLHECALGTIHIFAWLSAHMLICLSICASIHSQSVLYRRCQIWTILKRCHPSKVGLLTYVSTHAANDLITTLVICGPRWFGATVPSFHVRWLGKHN